MKKLLALMMLACLAVSLLPLAAYAGEGADSGEGALAADPAAVTAADTAAAPRLVPAIPMEYDYAQEFSGGYAFAVKGLTAGYLDAAGNFTACYEITQDLLDQFRVSEFSMAISGEGLYPWYDKDSAGWGVKDFASGKVILEAGYPGPSVCRDGRIVMNQGSGQQAFYEVFDTAGKLVFSGDGLAGFAYSHGLIAVANPAGAGDRASGIYDTQGERVLELKDVSVWESSRLLPYRAMTFEDPLERMNEEGVFSLYEEGNYTFYNQRGQKVFDQNDYYYGFNAAMGYTLHQDLDGRTLGITRMWDGARITPAVYGQVKYLSNGKFVIADKSGKVGIKDVQGNTLVPFLYDDAAIPGKGFNAVKLGDQWGVVDDGGKELLPFRYEELTADSSEALLYYQENGLWGHLALNGTRLTEPVYGEIYSPEEGLLLVGSADQAQVPEKYAETTSREPASAKYGFLKLGE